MNLIFSTILKIHAYLFLFLTFPIWLPFYIMMKVFTLFPMLAGIFVLNEIFGDECEDEEEY
ncbi:hypothetical protein [Thalassomonas sp. M1454]|uniref:hypothetical protein n=1 Tax=Thalassomonas sp. M1454 TaxID=2594477 RepID=UPI00117FD818|nr:hypothetical protein [Thalassomonas sp. M1454]TRX56704.1 hypothetical protein FNN08_04025 [Thalassomonas sp. M1454]